MPNTVLASQALTKLLAAEGFEPDDGDVSKENALRWAVSWMKPELVRHLINEGADLLSRDRESQRTALHIAAAQGACDLVTLVKEAGTPLSVVDNLGRTALLVAASQGHQDVLQLMISMGADVHHQDSYGFTSLHLAVIRDSCQAIEILLGDGKADPHCRGPLQLTPLHSACYMGHLDAAKILVAHSLDLLEYCDKDGHTPLHLAIKMNRQVIVEMLLEIGANVSAVSKKGRTSLHIAARYTPSQSEMVSVLLRYLPKGSLDTVDSHGDTAISLAILQRNNKTLRVLLNTGASCTIMNENRTTPLHHAAKIDNAEAIDILLAHGAQIEAKNSRGQTPLLVAAFYGNWSATTNLLNHGADIHVMTERGTLWYEAIHGGNINVVRLLLELGLDLEARTSHGKSLLSLAAKHGRRDIVRLLLDSDANDAAQNEEGWLPLHYAAVEGHDMVVELLLERGADPMAKDNSGRRPVHYAKKKGHQKVVDLLKREARSKSDTSSACKIHSAHASTVFIDIVSKGSRRQLMQRIDNVDVNAMDPNGRRPLTTAARYGHEAIVRILIGKGADASLADAQGESALWWAAWIGHEGLASYLVTCGAPPDLPDADGQTPLSAASQRGNAKIVELLLQHACDTDSTTCFGFTPLHYAASRGHATIVHLLIQAGASTRGETSNGNTALALATKYHHHAVVELLGGPATIASTQETKDPGSPDELEKAAAEQIRTLPDLYTYHENRWFICLARTGRVPEMIRKIKLGVSPNTRWNGEPAIIAAAERGEIDTVRALIAHGADLTAPHLAADSYGQTAMHVAVNCGQSEMIRVLCDNGLDANIHDASDRTPLTWAAEYGQKEAAMVLLDLGCDKERKDELGRTALFYAAIANQTAMAELLISDGADVNSSDKEGNTAFSIAVDHGHLSMAKLLLLNGALMKSVSDSGHSPLMIAATKGNDNVIEFLVANGADLNQLSENGETPLIKSVQHKHVMVTRLLLELGAATDVKDNNKRSALSYAKYWDDVSFVDALYESANLRHRAMGKGADGHRETLVKRMIYKYSKLKPGFIRVMQLKPGERYDPLTIELQEVNLLTRPSFEALSYEWGEKKGTYPIQCSQERILVTPNCKAALLRLRSTSTTKLLWVDSICINQEDVDERTQQVAMMTDIYRQAEKVYMWLGIGHDLTEKAFANLPRFSAAYRHSQEQTSTENNSNSSAVWDPVPNQGVLDAMMSLKSVTYFERAWIFQEIILAGQRGVVLCGEQTCTWPTYRDGIQGFILFMNSEAFEKRNLYSDFQLRSPTFLAITQVEDAIAMDGMIQLWFGMSAMWGGFRASDPRDMVFACLSLSSTGHGEVGIPVADYHLSTQEVFLQAASYFVSATGAVPWSLGGRPSVKVIKILPSWVPDYSVTLDVHYFLERFPERQRDYWNERFLSSLKAPFVSSNSLVVNAFLLDRVILTKSITKDQGAIGFVQEAVRALASIGCGIHDLAPPRAKKQTDQSEDDFNESNLISLLRVLFLEFQDSELHRDQLAAGFLAWQLSIDRETPVEYRQPPEELMASVASWEKMAKQEASFDPKIYETLEVNCRYGTDLVYTEKGYFAVTDQGEASEGMVIALVPSQSGLCLLREIKSGQRKPWYEYVDQVYMYRSSEVIERLDQFELDEGPIWLTIQ